MAIEKIVVLNEILFRLAVDGSVSGCHRRNLELVRDSISCEVYSAKELDPIPIVGDEVEAVLGTVNTGLTLSLNIANFEISDLQSQLQSANESIAALDQFIKELEQQLATASIEIARLSNELSIALAGKGGAGAGAE